MNIIAPKPTNSAPSSSWWLLGVFLISTRFFSFKGVSPRFFDAIELLLLGFFVAWGSKQFATNGASTRRPMWKFAVLLLAWPFVSFIPAYFVHGQSVLFSLMIQRGIFYWVVYFMLHQYQPTEKAIFKAIFIVAFVWTAITIGQQFTYPNFWFYTRLSENPLEPIEYRAGIYRYMVSAPEYAIVGLFFLVNKFVQEKRLLHILLATPLLIGIYYFGTRQVLFAALISTMFIVIAKAATNWRKYVPIGTAVIATVAGIIIYFYEPIFGELAEITLDDASSDNIRFRALHFYLFEYWDSWITPFLGNGLSHEGSRYGQEMLAIKYSGLFQSDIGIFGAFSLYGTFYVIIILYLLCYTIFAKRKNENLTIRAYFLYTAITLPLSSLFTLPPIIPIYCILFYLIDNSHSTTD